MAIGDANLIAGVGSLTLDGATLAIKANMTIAPDEVEREGIAGQSGVQGYKEMPRVPYIEADLSIQHMQSVSNLADITSSTLVAQLADGRTYTLGKAWYVGKSEIATQDGQWRARFEGMFCNEILG